MHLSGNLNDLQTAWNCSCKLQTVQCRWYFKRWGHVSGCTTQKCLSKLLLLAGDGASWTRNIYTTHKKYLTRQKRPLQLSEQAHLRRLTPVMISPSGSFTSCSTGCCFYKYSRKRVSLSPPCLASSQLILLRPTQSLKNTRWPSTQFQHDPRKSNYYRIFCCRSLKSQCRK